MGRCPAIEDRFTFTFPSWWRPTFGCCVAVSCFFVALGITVLFIRSSVEVTVMGALVVLAFGPVGWVCLDAWRRRGERIEVGPADITLVRADGSRLSMPWDSIVEVRERTVLCRLDVIDAHRRVIKIEYQVEGFANLSGIILERAACLGDQSSGATEFHRISLGGWPGVVLLALLGGCTAVALVNGELAGAAASVLFLMIVSAALYGEIRSVKVRLHDVVLQHFLSSRRISSIWRMSRRAAPMLGYRTPSRPSSS
jgi:hypothetical protein